MSWAFHIKAQKKHSKKTPTFLYFPNDCAGSSASTHNYRTVSVNFSLGTDSDISTGFQEILPSLNRRVKAHLESLLKPQQLTAIQIHTWEVAWSNPGQTDKLSWKFSLPDPQQGCLVQREGDFRRHERASGMSLDWDIIKWLAPKTGLLIGIAIIGKFAHPPSSRPIPDHRCGVPSPGWLLCTISATRLARSETTGFPGKPLIIFPIHRCALTCINLGSHRWELRLARQV